MALALAPASAPTSLNDYIPGPSAQDAIGHIVAAEGDLDLAAERLFGVVPPNSGQLPAKAQLVALIADDPTATSELQKQLRTLTLLQAFTSARLVGVTVEGTLPNLPASDRAKLYTSLLGVLASLTDEHSSSFNANISSTSLHAYSTEAIMRVLPPEVRESLKVLTLQPEASAGGAGDAPYKWAVGDPPPNAAVDD